VLVGARRFIVSKGKSFVVEMRVPSDLVPSGSNVYADIIDSDGSFVGNPVQMTQVGGWDLYRATLTAPSNTGKYDIVVWVGTWDGTTRSIDAVLDYLGLEVVDADIEDRLSNIETRLSDLENAVSELRNLVETVLRWMRRQVC